MIQSSENISPCNINYPNKRTVETIPSVRKVRKIGYREGNIFVNVILKL